MEDFKLENIKLAECIIRNNVELFGSMVELGCKTPAIIKDIELHLNKAISLFYRNKKETHHLTIYIEYSPLLVYVSYHGDEFREKIFNIIKRQYKVHEILN